MSPIKHSSPKSPSKKNVLELKSANQAAGLLTAIFGQSLAATKAPSQQKRLLAVLLQIIETDALHPPGQRIVPIGNVGLLEGFEFCTDHPLQKALPLRPEVLLDRRRGYCVVHIPPVLPHTLAKKQTAFTHFLLNVQVVAIHFDHDTAKSFATAAVPQALDTLAPLNLFIPFSADGHATLVVAIGLRFFKEQDGTLYELHEGKELLQIIKVDAGGQSGVRSQESGVLSQGAGGQSREPGERDTQAKVVHLKPENREQAPCRQGRSIKIVPLKPLPDGKAVKKTASRKKSKGRKAVPK